MGANGEDGLTYLVQTSLGNTLLPGHSTAFVNIEGDAFVEVAVEDLREGHMVMYKKEYITRTLEEIEPILERSARYAEARDTLHVKDEKGNRITRLRNDLFRSLGERAQIGNLESRLFGNENDFSESEYGRAIDAVESALKDGGHTHVYDRATIKHWLDGTTLAPLDWDVFKAFETTSVIFADYANPENGIREEYMLYVNVRKGVMHYIATKGKESEKTGSSHPRKPRGGSLKLEIDLVLDEFFQDISEQYAVAPITNISVVRPRRGEKREKPEESLSNGVVSKLPEEYAPKVISYAELAVHINILEALHNFQMWRYFRTGAESDLVSRIKVSPFGSHYAATMWVDSALTGFFGIEKNFDRQILGVVKKLYSDVSGFKRRLYHAHLDGTIDRVIGLEEGACHKTYRALARVRAVMPEIFETYDVLVQDLKGGVLKDTPATKLRYIKMEKELREKYGIEPLSVKRMLPTLFYFELVEKTIRRHLDDPEEMNRLAQRAAEWEALDRVVSKSEFTSVANRYGLAGYMLVIPEAIWAADGWRTP